MFMVIQEIEGHAYISYANKIGTSMARRCRVLENHQYNIEEGILYVTGNEVETIIASEKEDDLFDFVYKKGEIDKEIRDPVHTTKGWIKKREILKGGVYLIKGSSKVTFTFSCFTIKE